MQRSSHNLRGGVMVDHCHLSGGKHPDPVFHPKTTWADMENTWHSISATKDVQRREVFEKDETKVKPTTLGIFQSET